MSADTDRVYWDSHTSDGRCKYPRTCEAEGCRPTPDETALREKIAKAFCEPAHRSRWPLEFVNTYCGQCWTRSEAALPLIHAEVKWAQAQALRDAVERDAITIPDVLGYKVRAVAVEDLLDRADLIEKEQNDG